MLPRTALVLTGGGARGAYQAGFLKGIADSVPDTPSPFAIITGCSVGAINAAFLACHGNNFSEATNKLWHMWANLEPNGIFIPRPAAFLKIGLKLLLHLIFRRRMPFTATLLDNLPLKKMLRDQLNFANLRGSIERKEIHAVAFTAMDYIRRASTTFFDADSVVPSWDERSTLGKRTPLCVDHVVGSAGLPLLFEPVKIDDSYYGDGSIKLSSPLGPALRMGAEKILVITTYELRSPDIDIKNQQQEIPSFSSIFDTLLQSAFTDALDKDFERLKERNRFAGHIVEGKELRQIPALKYKPTKDLASLATASYSKLPVTYKHFLSLLGAMETCDHTFLSYLTFEKSYLNLLLEAGYKDAINQKRTIMDFIALKSEAAD
jgi:NTE family protein